MRKAGLGKTETSWKDSCHLFSGCTLKLSPRFCPWPFASCSACEWSCWISPFVSRRDQRDTQYGCDILKTKVTSFLPYLHCCPGLLSLTHFLEGAGWMWSFRLHINSLACLSLSYFIFSQQSLMLYNCLFSCGLSQAFCFYFFFIINPNFPFIRDWIRKRKGWKLNGWFLLFDYRLKLVVKFLFFTEPVAFYNLPFWFLTIWFSLEVILKYKLWRQNTSLQSPGQY